MSEEKKSKKDTIFCPLFSNPAAGAVLCKREQCGFYIREFKMCAMVSIAWDLDDIRRGLR